MSIAVSHDEAVQELLVLRQQVAELRSAQPLTGVYQSQQGKRGHRSGSSVLAGDLSEAFEMSENLVSFIVRVHLIIGVARGHWEQYTPKGSRFTGHLPPQDAFWGS